VGSATVAEGWNGVTWTAQTTPPNNDGPDITFGSVTCPSETTCFADGAFVNNLVGGAHETLAESWIGNTWTMLSTPNPAGSGNSYLSGITCGSSTTCTAVGWSNNGSADLTLVEQYK